MLKLQVPGRDIIYNGPNKTLESIEKSIQKDVLINIDSVSELETVINIASRLDQLSRVGLRICPISRGRDDLVWDKFGLSFEEGEISSAIELITSQSYLKLEALHMHIGTNVNQTDKYLEALKHMLFLLKTYGERLTSNLKYIDIGGGFAGGFDAVPLNVHPDEWSPLDISNLSTLIDTELGLLDPFNKLSIIMEPGRIIAETAMSLLSTVVGIKKRNKNHHIILDAGTNILPSAFYTSHSISFLSNNEAAKYQSVIHGPLCTQHDIIAYSAKTPELEIGDLVLINDTGAYTLSFASQFVGPRPPIVMIRNGDTFLARKKEPEDVLWKYDETIL